MSDKVEKIGHSIIQHGTENNRIYLMKFNNLDKPNIISNLDTLAKENNYSKIFAKVPEKAKNLFIENNYVQEAYIPNFYKGVEDCVFLSKYLNNERRNLAFESEIEEILKSAKNKAKNSEIPTLPDNLAIKILDLKDIHNMIDLYKKVFKTYPFPIYEEEYIKQTMKDNITYFGIYKENTLIAISSSEIDKENLNCEMTDFAILPEHRGNNYSLILLKEMERNIKEKKYKLLYTIARAMSYGMNTTFAKLNYIYGGLLINNTNIAGNIESMNVWYKEI